MPTQDDSLDDSIANDILRGAKQIGRFVGDEDERQTYHALESGHYPAKKVGGVWIGSKAVLTEFFRTPNNAKPPKTSTDSTAEAPSPPRPARARSGRSATDSGAGSNAAAPPLRAARSGTRIVANDGRAPLARRPIGGRSG